MDDCWVRGYQCFEDSGVPIPDAPVDRPISYDSRGFTPCCEAKLSNVETAAAWPFMVAMMTARLRFDIDIACTSRTSLLSTLGRCCI